MLGPIYCFCCILNLTGVLVQIVPEMEIKLKTRQTWDNLVVSTVKDMRRYTVYKINAAVRLSVIVAAIRLVVNVVD